MSDISKKVTKSAELNEALKEKISIKKPIVRPGNIKGDSSDWEEAWVRLGNPWVKSIGGSSKVASINLSKDLSASKIKELTALGATISDTITVSFPEEKLSAVKELLDK
ncbi:MAG: hypothetical protein MJ089_07695 [Ruminococcus sp.]|nr:hypothetical protein [Ruminococcus sp.]